MGKYHPHRYPWYSFFTPSFEDLENPEQDHVKYIANRAFGYDKDFDAFIHDAIRRFKPTKDYFYNKEILLELYETYYGIRDHIRDPHPFGSVLYNKSEMYLDNYLLDNYMLLFQRRKIGTQFNISFDDFINRPRNEVDRILRMASKVLDQDQDANKKALDALEADNKKKAKQQQERFEF